MPKRFLPSGQFSRNVLTIFTGTAFAQAIPLLFSPLLTRLYSPAEFGLIALFVSIVNSLASPATGRYELAVMLPAEDREAASLAATATSSSLIFSIILFGIVMIFNVEISALLDSPQILPWLCLIPVAVFLTAVYQVLSYWLLRRKAFRASSVNKIAQSSGTTVSGLALGELSFPGGLVLADIAGRALGLVVSVYQSLKNGLGLNSFNKAGMKEQAIKYKQYPLYNSIPAFLDKLSLNLPTITLNMFYGSVVTGFFNFSRQIAGSPLLLISYSLSQVYFRELTELRTLNKKILPEFKKMAIRLSLVALVYLLLTVFLAPPVFSFVFGEEWRKAGEFAVILSFAVAAKFIASPLSVVLLSVNAVKITSYWQVLYFCSIAALFFLGQISITQFLIAYTLIETLVYALYFYLSFVAAKKNDHNLIQAGDNTLKK